MHTSFLQSSKATAITLVLVSLLFSLIFAPVQQVHATALSSGGAGGGKSGSRLINTTSSGGSVIQTGVVTSQSSDTSLQARLDAALKQIAELKARIAASGQGGTVKDADSARKCVPITHTFRRGSSDATTGGDVTRLQTFLAKDKTLYPEGSITGFYGEATEKAVQLFQSRNGIVHGGTALSTGYGSIGGQTRMFIGRVCEEGTVPTPITTPYTLDDVKEITAQSVDPIANAVDDEYTLYTLTLKNGTVRTFKRGFAGPGVFEKAVKATGYTGDIEKLLAKAVEVARTQTYALTDVKSITVVDKRTFDGDAVYTIILNSGESRTVSVGARNTAAKTAKAFKKSGYTGDVAALLAKVAESTTSNSYSLADVMTVIRLISPATIADAPTTYVITLKSGRIVRVITAGNMTAAMFEKAFRDGGYTGDVSKLLARVDTQARVCMSGDVSYPEGTVRTSIVLPNGQTSVINDAYYRCTDGVWGISSGRTDVTTGKYSLADIKYIAMRYAWAPSNAGATQYKITLTNNRKIEVSRMDAEISNYFEKSLKATGYTGGIAEFIAKAKTDTARSCRIGEALHPEGTILPNVYSNPAEGAFVSNADVPYLCTSGVWGRTSPASGAPKTGSVFGIQTSSADVLLDEIFERLDALSLLIE